MWEGVLGGGGGGVTVAGPVGVQSWSWPNVQYLVKYGEAGNVI